MSIGMQSNGLARHRGSRLGRIARTLGTTVALGLWAAAMWRAWFSWDRERLDIGDGMSYSVALKPQLWQVIGCGLSVAAFAVLAYLWVRRESIGYGIASIALLAIAGPLGFVVPWARDQASDPTEDGLFLIGALFIFLYGTAALGALLGVVEGIASQRHSRFGGRRLR